MCGGGIIVDLRFKFNEVADEYDRWRPTYVPQLYNDILDFKKIDQTSSVLEIGIGTGQATLPILKTNCHLTAVELGDELAEFSRRKFQEYNNFQVKNIAFEGFESPDNSFDMVYSATAFHWIPEEIGYPKVYKLLKSGGIFARFRNRTYKDKENEQLHIAIQKVYAKYMPYSPETPEYNEEECIKINDIAKKYGFIDVNYKLYHRVRTLDADGYVSLLNTYSDHRALREDQRKLLYKEIKDAINSLGGKINIYDTIDLHLARKP
jgi:SAM-dependent methyltransferase